MHKTIHIYRLLKLNDYKGDCIIGGKNDCHLSHRAVLSSSPLYVTSVRYQNVSKPLRIISRVDSGHRDPAVGANTTRYIMFLSIYAFTLICP